MKDVQCYELFGGIALKNHAFSFLFIFSLCNKTIIRRPKLSNTPVSFLSGVLAVDVNRKNLTKFLTSNFGVVD